MGKEDFYWFESPEVWLLVCSATYVLRCPSKSLSYAALENGVRSPGEGEWTLYITSGVYQSQETRASRLIFSPRGWGQWDSTVFREQWQLPLDECLLGAGYVPKKK